MEEEDSVFRFYQKLIALRKENPVMVHGDFRLCCDREGPVIAYTRSLGRETWLAVHNFSGGKVRFDHEKLTGHGEVVISNYEEPETEQGSVTLRPYETLVVRV